jgi:hypothetical protein
MATAAAAFSVVHSQLSRPSGSRQAGTVPDLDELLPRFGGAASRNLLLRGGVTRTQIDNAIRRGRLVAVLPRTYCRPWDVDDVAIRERAALMSVGHPAALSHLSGLRRWRLLEIPPDAVHVTVPVHRYLQPTSEIVVHRATRFPPVVLLDRSLTVEFPSRLPRRGRCCPRPSDAAPRSARCGSD